jgi:hypothetical protein
MRDVSKRVLCATSATTPASSALPTPEPLGGDLRHLRYDIIPSLRVHKMCLKNRSNQGDSIWQRSTRAQSTTPMQRNTMNMPRSTIGKLQSIMRQAITKKRATTRTSLTDMDCTRRIMQRKRANITPTLMEVRSLDRRGPYPGMIPVRQLSTTAGPKCACPLISSLRRS